MDENTISSIIVDSAIEVHRTLGGPGLLESVYEVIWQAQMLTYLRLSQRKLGLVINFGHKLLKHNIHRVVNGL